MKFTSVELPFKFLDLFFKLLDLEVASQFLIIFEEPNFLSNLDPGFVKTKAFVGSNFDKLTLMLVLKGTDLLKPILRHPLINKLHLPFLEDPSLVLS